jgi:cyclic pyranopterin phosphate synthase
VKKPEGPRGRARAARLTHLDARGRARMVDVSGKTPTVREAVAEGAIRMSPAAYRAVRRGTLEKGNVAAVARVAAIAAAKRTSDLIPLCHPVPLEHLGVAIAWKAGTREVRVETTARARWSTGVEMEALVAVTAALLTIYDMAKGIDRGMIIGPVRLLRKSGGRSGLFVGRRGR